MQCEQVVRRDGPPAREEMWFRNTLQKLFKDDATPHACVQCAHMSHARALNLLLVNLSFIIAFETLIMLAETHDGEYAR